MHATHKARAHADGGEPFAACRGNVTSGNHARTVRRAWTPILQPPAVRNGATGGLMGVTDTETSMLPDSFQKRNVRSKI